MNNNNTKLNNSVTNSVTQKQEFCPVSSIKTYFNTEADKVQILSDNKNKSGIYMFQNLTNDKQYIGSSENLKRRFQEYFNVNHLTRSNSMNICRALLKHGYCNFSLTILEYCSVSDLLIREKHYWDIFNPKYNIAQDPSAPMSGRTHSDATKTIMSEAKKGENHPNFGKTLNDETKTKISDTAKKIDNSGWFKTGHQPANKGKTLSNNTKQKISDAMSTSIKIEVTDITNNITTSYNSINEAARALNIHKSVIDNYFRRNQQKPYKGQYTFIKTK
jgi:group I intron endonuclease